MLLQGTLTTYGRRCGKAGCVPTGTPHQSPALRFTEGGRIKTLTLSPGEVAQVTAALARYEQAKSELDAQAAEGLTRLRVERRSGQCPLKDSHPKIREGPCPRAGVAVRRSPHGPSATTAGGALLCVGPSRRGHPRSASMRVLPVGGVCRVGAPAATSRATVPS